MGEMFRLAVIAEGGAAEVVVEQGGKLLPLSTVLGADLSGRLGPPVADLMPLLTDWPTWNTILEERVGICAALFDREGRQARDTKFMPPVAAPGKIVCIGANYHDHVAEMPIPMVPKYPYSFLKPANNTLRGSGDPVRVPKAVRMMDWEAELALVIGRQCHDIGAADALAVVAGYTNFNDLSARDWIESRPPIGVDWIWHKAFDGFAPMGPYFVPSQFVADPQNLPIRLTVNGAVKQNSTTGQMIFGVAAILEHLTAIMTLYPGDVIATGTAAGVGHGRHPPEYLFAGDEIRMQIGSLGELVTPII